MLFSTSCAALMPRPTEARSPEKGFQNTYLEEDHTFFDFLKWRWQRLGKDIPPPDSFSFRLAENDPSYLRSNREKTTLTWIGHATVLLQIGGKNILTDPHFSERASPVQWAGPRRVVSPGIALNDLPPIEFVIISHDHYDSLDTQTVKKLYKRERGHETKFLVPLGLMRWFQRLGIHNVIELNWWEDYEEEGLKIIATPMQHWGKRSPFSRNEHLWASWVIVSEDFRFYFGGDTGYSPHFREIGQKYGPFDLSTIPIGAYEPRWFMRNHHINPEEAVQAHMDLRSRLSVAIHWGTFMLTDEPLDEPPVRLGKALEQQGIAAEEFRVLQHGETIILGRE